MNAEKQTATVIEAAKMLGVNRGAIYNMMNNGTLPAIKIGIKRRIIPLAALERILQEGTERKTA